MASQLQGLVQGRRGAIMATKNLSRRDLLQTTVAATAVASIASHPLTTFAAAKENQTLRRLLVLQCGWGEMGYREDLRNC